MTDDNEKTREQLLAEVAILRQQNQTLQASLKHQHQEAEQLHLLHDAAFEGVMIHDKGVLLAANDQYFKMFGYEPHELIGKQVLPLTVLPESLDCKSRHTTPEGVTVYEIKGVRKNGDTFLMEVRGKLMNYQDKTVRGVAVADITERKRVENAWLESESMLRFLSNRLFIAQEEERGRLAKELHDQLGHDLVLLKSRFRLLCRKLGEVYTAFNQDFEGVVTNIDQIIENVRRISRDLKPSVLEDLGLFASIQSLVENFSRQYGLVISLDMADIDHLFSRDAQIGLYRIFQESLTNIAKHSEARHVSVVIKKENGCIVFNVQDDGKGFDVKKVMARKYHEKGIGLTAMTERMRSMGGTFEVTSQLTGGTTIHFTIPIEEKEV